MITLLAEQPCVDPPTESKEKRIKKTNGEEKKKGTMHFALVTWTHESKKIKLRMGSRNGVRVAPVEIERQEVRWHSRARLESSLISFYFLEAQLDTFEVK